MSSQVTRGQARSECRVSGGTVPVGSQRSDEATVQQREVTRCPVRSHEVSKVRVQSKWGYSSSRITEVRRGHSTAEGGVQSGQTRSGEVKVQSKWRSSYSQIIEDRRGHSTEEGGVQPGHRGQTRSSCRGGPAPVRSQRTDEVTVQKREVSSQVTRGQARSECRVAGDPVPVGSQRSDEVTVQKREYRRGRCPVRSHKVRQGKSAE